MNNDFRIYCIDFDGTIVQDKWPEIGELIPETAELIRAIKARGDYWILYTMRSEENLQEALDFLGENDLIPDTVNDNLPLHVKKWGNNPRKIFADCYIDNHNLGGLDLEAIRKETIR